MTRKQYLSFRNKNLIGNIVYEVYYNICIEKNIKTLSSDEFMLSFSMWRHNQEYVERILAYYDIQHTILKLVYENKVIKYL